MRKHETTKLFWGQYLYKLAIKNSLGTSFRNKNLYYANEVLESLQKTYTEGFPLKLERYKRTDWISESHFLDAKQLYQHLSRNNDYMLRIERSTVCIYSNNKSWLDSLENSLHKENIAEVWEPNLNHVNNLESNTILIQKPIPYDFRVTLRGGSNQTQSFANWAKTNPKQVKVGSKLLEQLEKNGFVDGMYFYARDDKTLQLCNLMLTNIRRVDKLIVKQNIDK